MKSYKSVNSDKFIWNFKISLFICIWKIGMVAVEKGCNVLSIKLYFAINCHENFQYLKGTKFQIILLILNAILEKK